MAYDYDLFVIGGGSGGVRASRMAAQAGKRVAIAEEYRYGGTCVIRGCVPKKLLVYASRFAHEFEDAAGFGWTLGERRFDWHALIAAKDKEIARLESVYERNLGGAGVRDVLKTRATLVDAHTVRLHEDDRTVTAERILIATGGTPVVPDMDGASLAITSNEAFHLPDLPKRVLVVGGGYIAVEFAGIFAGLGAQTTLAYRRDKILRGFDEDLRDSLQEELPEHGVNLILNATPTKIEARDEARRVTMSDGQTIDVDCVMFATGRRPNTVALGLEDVGVNTNAKGAIKVDGFSQTSVENIWAVGDVTDRVNLTPVAIREGAAFVKTVYQDNPTKADHEIIPTAVFSTPELGTVGVSEADAREAGHDVEIYRARFRPMKHTLSGRDEKSMMKIIVDKADRKVLGVHIMGEAAGEIIQCVGIAVKMGATKEDFDATMAVHPTMSEELVTMATPVA